MQVGYQTVIVTQEQVVEEQEPLVELLQVVVLELAVSE